MTGHLPASPFGKNAGLSKVASKLHFHRPTPLITTCFCLLVQLSFARHSITLAKSTSRSCSHSAVLLLASGSIASATLIAHSAGRELEGAAAGEVQRFLKKFTALFEVTGLGLSVVLLLYLRTIARRKNSATPSTTRARAAFTKERAGICRDDLEELGDPLLSLSEDRGRTSKRELLRFHAILSEPNILLVSSWRVRWRVANAAAVALTEVGK